jgi:hypothetical protein
MISQQFRPPWPVLSVTSSSWNLELYFNNIIISMILSFFIVNLVQVAMFSLSSCLFFCHFLKAGPVSLAFACHIIVSYLWQPPTIQLKLVLAIPDVVWTEHCTCSLVPAIPDEIWPRISCIGPSLYSQLSSNRSVLFLSSTISSDFNYPWCISCNSYQPLVVNHTLVISPIALMMIGTGFGDIYIFYRK